MKTSFFDSLATWSLYLLALLIPIGYFPWTVDTLEINKQTILLILASVAALSWLGAMIKAKEAFLKKHYALLFAGLVVGAYAISSLFSLGPFTSWVGNGLQAYTSTMSMVGFVLVLIVGAHYLHAVSVRYQAWFWLLLGSGIIALNALLAMIGLPIVQTNFIGTPNALALYLVVMATISCALWLVEGKQLKNMLSWKATIMHICMALTVIAALFVALSLDYWLIWGALLLGTGALFAFAFFRAEEFPHLTRFMAPMVLFVVSLLFLFFPSVLNTVFQIEVAPSFTTGWDITTEALGDTSWLIGSGPGTFALDYDKYRDISINATELWDARFDRAGQHWVTILATTGLLGLSLFVLFLLSLGTTILRDLISRGSHESWRMLLVSTIGWMVLVFGMIFYSSNMTLAFLFWFLSAMLLAYQAKDVKHWKFSTNPRGALATAFLFVLVNVGLLTMLFVTVSRYGSEIAFAKAVQTDRSGGDLEEVILDLDAAARMNKLNDVYYRNLSHALLLRAAELVEDPNVSSDQLRDFIATSIRSAQRATELAPNDAQNWAVLGDLYLEVSPVVSDAADQAILAYENAAERSPANPKYLSALAQAYLAQVQQLEILMESEDDDLAASAELARDEALTAAITAAEQAIELKSDYANAHYQLAILLEAQGNLTESITRMESLRAAYPSDIGVSFQLGLLYLRQGKMTEAEAELLRTIELAPTFANAYWYLSSVYEDAGDFDTAIIAVEKVLELNPEDELVLQRLERLREGKVASELPDPVEEGGDGEVDTQGVEIE